ncbi:MAG: hypothetical protein L0Y56_01350, partial [Nitrospira sp.]|nr:hypothetical protein [Nitrospira sp.]
TREEKSKVTALNQQLKSVLEDRPFDQVQDSESTLSLSKGYGSSRPATQVVATTSLESKEPFIPEKPLHAETVRISTAKLDSLLLQVEEMLSVKLRINQLVADLQDIKALFDPWRKEWAKIQPEIPRNGRLRIADYGLGSENLQSAIHNQKLLEFLDWNHAYIKSLESKLATLVKSAEYDNRSLGGMVDNLLEDMKKVLMLPFSSLLEVFPKLARDLSRDRGKEVELVIRGGNIEIDKRILEEMKDPLIHLIRNCIDHGIENPKEREDKKKPLRGTIIIAIAQKDSSKVEILISDDGAGINLAKVKETVVKRGLVAEREVEKLNEQEVLSFIFQSGVSTSPLITDISGRGL